MEIITLDDVLESKNFVSHTRVYVDDELRVDTSIGVMDTPVLSYQINRSRKLGAAKLNLNVANPGGVFSFNRHDNPIFGYGNRIKLQEGILVGETIEWFTRFTGIIVSQVPSNMEGKPSLKVYAMDNMKLLLDYLPDELYYRPDMIFVKGEVLTEVTGGDFMHYRGNQDNLPWVDIPYPIFYKNGVKIKEDYEIDLINGEVYFGERMYSSKTFAATKVTSTRYTIPVFVRPGFTIRRSFRMCKLLSTKMFSSVEIPKDITVTYNDNEIIFSRDPFADLHQSWDRRYDKKTICVTTEIPSQVTADYWYYDDNTNLAEDVIRKLALQAGFKAEHIILGPTASETTSVSLRPMRFTNLTVKSGFEALQKIKQQLRPNYIITCDTEGNLRGYLSKNDLLYNLQLIKRIDAPVSEENLYSAIVAHGVDLNPNDLRNIATAQNIPLPPPPPPPIGWFGGNNNVIEVKGTPASVLNKKTDDQISWHWIQKNNDVPPEFPIDLMTISLAEAKKVEEISIVVGDYNKGTIQQSLSVQVTENGNDWFYIDRSSRGLTGASSQWIAVKGGELENCRIKGIKLIAEGAFNWTESHSYSAGGILGFGSHVNTDNYYHWYLAIREVQIWEENTIEVTSAICNCIGIGDGVNPTFYIPNKPIVKDSVTIYQDGDLVAPAAYEVDPTTAKVSFLTAPQGIITADYSVLAKQQPRSQSTNNDRFANNATVINSVVTEEFTGGSNLSPANKKLLKKIGLKKNALKADNYLNSFHDVKVRGEEMLGEISRLEETLDMDVVYRPDIDICQTVGVDDPLLGITGCYFVEEITENKQGYRPSLNIKVSKYS
jgi:hypothetical protein